MFEFYKKWILNVPVIRKFIPLQVFVLLLVICTGYVSVSSIQKIDANTEVILTDNLENRVLLQQMRSYMWACRVNGRDILLQSTQENRELVYNNYMLSYEKLDNAMDSFYLRLVGERKVEFKRIIEEKNKYKEIMLLSADIKLFENDFEKALIALNSVTPIAQAFFKSLDDYYAYEVATMEKALEENSDLVNDVIFTGIFITVIATLVVYLLVRYSINIVVNQLLALLDNVTRISYTGNMKIAIEQRFFTQDEVGLIARVINKLKTMLLEYSFKDLLTQGYNASAYRSELFDLFESTEFKNTVKSFWCLIFDMNNLKHINDVYGHMEGDAAIISAHTILLECFGKLGKVYRVGGDEFICIIDSATEEIIDEKLEKMNELVLVHNQDKQGHFSIASGYGFFNGVTRKEFDEMYALIDKKMYLNKDYLKQSRVDARVNVEASTTSSK